MMCTNNNIYSGRAGDHSVRQKTLRITNPLSQHHLPNRITQHNKLHKIIKLIKTLNPIEHIIFGLHTLAFTFSRVTKEDSLIRLEHRTAACEALILTLIGFVNCVAKLAHSVAP